MKSVLQTIVFMATDPVFEGLSCTGYWGSYYGDHEMERLLEMVNRMTIGKKKDIF